MQSTVQLSLRIKEHISTLFRKSLENGIMQQKRNEVEILERNRQSDTKFVADMIIWKIHM